MCGGGGGGVGGESKGGLAFIRLPSSNGGVLCLITSQFGSDLVSLSLTLFVVVMVFDLVR